MLDVPLRDDDPVLLVQSAPDLLARAMLAEAQIPDPHQHVQPIAVSVDLPRFGAGRTVHRAPKHARGVAASKAQVRDVLGSAQKLDRLGPHRMRPAQRRPALRTVRHLRTVADMRQRSDPARRFHHTLLAVLAPPLNSLPARLCLTTEPQALDTRAQLPAFLMPL